MAEPVITTEVPQTAPDFVHELFWGTVSSLLGEQLQRYQPKMGTVQSVTSNYLLVIPDGSDPSQPPVARKMLHVAGRRWRNGDRVIFGPVKGQNVVFGGVLTATGVQQEGVVSTADMDQSFQNTMNSITAQISSVDARVTSVSNSVTAVDNRVTSLKGEVGTYNTNNPLNSDGIWGVALNARDQAGKAKDKADAASGLATAADQHAQNVYNILSGITGSGNVGQGTALYNAVGNGQQAHDRLQDNVNGRLEAVCLKVCKSKACAGKCGWRGAG